MIDSITSSAITPPVLTDAQWKNLHAQTTNAGILELVDSTNRPVKFGISFRGLAQAIDAAAKE